MKARLVAVNAELEKVSILKAVYRMAVPEGWDDWPVAVWFRNGGVTAGDTDGGASYQSVRILILGPDYGQVDDAVEGVIRRLKQADLLANDPDPPTDILHEDMEPQMLGSELLVTVSP